MSGQAGTRAGRGARSGGSWTSPPFWVSPQDLDCFVIDNNGFILISGRPQEVRHWGSGVRGKSRHPTAPASKKGLIGSGSNTGLELIRVKDLKKMVSLLETKTTIARLQNSDTFQLRWL